MRPRIHDRQNPFLDLHFAYALARAGDEWSARLGERLAGALGIIAMLTVRADSVAAVAVYTIIFMPTYAMRHLALPMPNTYLAGLLTGAVRAWKARPGARAFLTRLLWIAIGFTAVRAAIKGLVQRG